MMTKESDMTQSSLQQVEVRRGFDVNNEKYRIEFEVINKLDVCPLPIIL